MFGPVVIVAGVGSWSIEAAVLLCAASELAGNFAFSIHPASRGWLPAGDRPADILGALRGSGVLVLVAAFLLAGMAIGAIEVAVPALLDESGQRDLTGLLFGFWGLGSMAAGFVVGRAGPGRNPPRRLALLLVVWGAGARGGRARQLAALDRTAAARGGQRDRPHVRLRERDARQARAARHADGGVHMDRNRPDGGHRRRQRARWRDHRRGVPRHGDADPRLRRPRRRRAGCGYGFGSAGGAAAALRPGRPALSADARRAERARP